MNKQQAEALEVGQRVSWKSGAISLFGRILDQSTHSAAACSSTHIAVARNGDVHWVEPHRLGRITAAR